VAGFFRATAFGAAFFAIFLAGALVARCAGAPGVGVSAGVASSIGSVL
jgi:hypothetical protein